MNHIAILLPGIDRVSGAEQQALLIARQMVRRQWRVTVIAMSGSGGEAGASLAQEGIPFFSLQMRKAFLDPRGWKQLKVWLQQEKPDILHAHLPHATWLARWSRFLTPTRVQMDTLHTSSLGPSTRQLGYRSSRWIPTCVTAVSKSVAQAYANANLVDVDRLLVLPNAVDTDHWKPSDSARSSLRLQLGIGDAFLWATVGRLEPVKDYPLLLQAFARLDFSVHLAIAGDGSLRKPLQRLAEHLGIVGRVHFLGFLSDPLPLLQSTDAFALASLWEGLPIAVLEAGACALPIVATDVPGTANVLTHGQNGLLTVLGNLEAMTAAMQRLMEMSEAERQAMGTSAREEIVRHYRMDFVMEQWHSLYLKLLEGNTQPLRMG